SRSTYSNATNPSASAIRSHSSTPMPVQEPPSDSGRIENGGGSRLPDGVVLSRKRRAAQGEGEESRQSERNKGRSVHARKMWAKTIPTGQPVSENARARNAPSRAKRACPARVSRTILAKAR